MRVLPGVTMNISKRGVSSFSFGQRGMHYTVGRKSQRVTVGIPGSGLFLTDFSPRPYTKPSTTTVVILALIAFGLLLALSNCTPITWERPMTSQAEYSMDRARCQLTAKSMAPDLGPDRIYYTRASAAGDAIGRGIVLGLERAENFQLCMRANGYVARAQ